VQFSVVEEKPSAGLGEKSETTSEMRERVCVKEEMLGGEGNYGACVETMWRLTLLL
jgi:hypothetical protein